MNKKVTFVILIAAAIGMYVSIFFVMS